MRLETSSQPTIINPSPSPANLEPVFPRNEFIGGAAEEDSMRRLIQFVRKRAWIIVTAALLGLGGAVVANLILPTRYTARASVELIQDRSSQFLLQQSSDLRDASSMDAAQIDTVIAVLRSNALALETIQRLGLQNNPDFLKRKNGGSWNLSNPMDRAIMIGTFLSRLDVNRLGHTNVVEIRYSSASPELAALISNTLIDSYIEHNFKENFTSTAKISQWLDSQLGGLKKRLEDSQQRMVQLQKELGIFGIDHSNSKDQSGGSTQSVLLANLEELNKELVDAQAQRMQKEAELRAIQSSSPEVIDSISAVDRTFQSQRELLSELQTEYTSLVQTYGSAYPRISQLKAQIAHLQKEITAKEATQVARVQKELQAAQERQGLIQQSVQAQEKKASDSSDTAIQYEFARLAYDSNRELYDALQGRLQEAGIIAGLHSTAVHLVDNADIPPFPSHPRKTMNLAGGLGIGTFLGLALAFLLEAVDTNLKSITEIEDVLQLPLIAGLPQSNTSALLPSKFNEEAMAGNIGSMSRIAEALRGMRTSILLSSPGAPPKVIMIASTRPSEGKTSTSILASIVFALNGAKVLLIDADLRRPKIHQRFGVKQSPGLSNVLSGKAALQEAVQVWPDQPRLHLLPSGPVPPLPSELLGSSEMGALLQEAREHYDFIFIDTPPVLAVTDASVLGRLADATILVVRFGEAKRNVVVRSIEVLERSGAHMLGVALNMVDLRSPEYVEYYGRKYYDYYGERPPEGQ
jgi:capsular exopolysaccharide synthesis family protein